jgi:hypothetical protein
MKRIVLLVLVIGFSNYSFCQFYRPLSSGGALEYNKAARNIQFLKAGNMVTYSLDEIEGFPQIFNGFKPGKITLNNDTTLFVPINYNAFIDAIEFQNDNINYILTNNFGVKRIEVEGREFVYRIYTNDKNREVQGYLEVLASGNFKLLKKNSKTFSEPIPAETHFHNPKPARFSDNVYSTYFLEDQMNEVSFLNTSSNRKLISHFSNKKDALRIFIKEKKLNIRNESDLIKLIDYINSL